MADKDKRDARDDKEEEAGDETKSSAGNSRLKDILLLVLGAVLLVGVSIGTTLMVAGKGSSDDTEAAADEAADNGEATDKKGKKDKKSKKKKGKDKGDKEESASSATEYLSLDPPFVVNFESNPQEARFLQVNVEVMARDPAALEDVKKHMPAIRNSLVLLLSSQNYKTLSTLEGKEKVRAAALSVIQQILTERTGKPGVEAVYFTGFVMQ